MSKFEKIKDFCLKNDIYDKDFEECRVLVKKMNGTYSDHEVCCSEKICPLLKELDGLSETFT